MNPPRQSEARRIADEIRGYLAANPRASDTVAGVVRWWLMRQRFQEDWELVERALELLVEEGTVRRLRTPSGETLYRGADDDGDA